MRVTLPFVYEITHQKPGKDKPTTSAAYDSVFAEVPEVSRSEVDVAAKWEVLSALESVISWNGNLYMAAGISSDTLLDRQAADDHMNQQNLNVLYGHPHWPSVAGKQLLRALRSDAPAQTVSKTKIVSTTLDRDKLEAQHMIDGILIVDGQVWHRIPAIMFCLSDQRLSILPAPYGHRKIALLEGMAGIQNPLLTRYFALDEMELAIAHAPDNVVQRRFKNLVIFQPDLLPFDGQSEFAARVTNSAVRTNEYRVGEMSDREISLWMRMRDAVAGWYGIPSAPITEADVEALYEFCAMTPKSHMNDWPRRGCEILDEYRAHAGAKPSRGSPQPRP
ncbi:hypothetical protein O9X98_14650 [Agrobacterium salinitolerans]|nr:hypothetical protein [Agrobacterium salinitolerans]